MDPENDEILNQTKHWETYLKRLQNVESKIANI
jgi:hypothetical protein